MINERTYRYVAFDISDKSYNKTFTKLLSLKKWMEKQNGRKMNFLMKEEFERLKESKDLPKVNRRTKIKV